MGQAKSCPECPNPVDCPVCEDEWSSNMSQKELDEKMEKQGKMFGHNPRKKRRKSKRKRKKPKRKRKKSKKSRKRRRSRKR